MTVLTARDFVRQFGRSPSGDSSVVLDEDVDRAIQAACDDFIEATGATLTTTTIAGSSGDATVALPSGVRPHYVRSVYVEHATDDYKGTPLSIVGIEDVLVDRRAEAALTAPTKIAFLNQAVGVINSDLLEDRDFTVRYVPPLTSWTPGDAGATELNVDERWLRTVLIYGATSMLQHTDVEHLYASESWKKYLTFRDRLAATGIGTVRVKAPRMTMIPES